MRKWLMVVALFALVCSAPVLAFEPVAQDHRLFDLQTRIFRVVDLNWRAAEALVDGSEEAHDRALAAFERETKDLGTALSEAVAGNDHEALDLAGSIWRSLDVGARRALHPALGMVRVAAADSRGGFNDYFPGYGYPEPGYKYRRGLEIEREEKGTTWQYEEHTLTTNKKFDLTVTLDVLGILKKWLSGGILKSLHVREYGNGYYNNQPMIVAHVSLETSETVATRANRKYDVTKVWFELLRSKDAGWHNSGTWEKCGKTYEIMQDPTGEVITTGAQLPGQPGQPGLPGQPGTYPPGTYPPANPPGTYPPSYPPSYPPGTTPPGYPGSYPYPPAQPGNGPFLPGPI